MFQRTQMSYRMVSIIMCLSALTEACKTDSIESCTRGDSDRDVLLQVKVNVHEDDENENEDDDAGVGTMKIAATIGKYVPTGGRKSRQNRMKTNATLHGGVWDYNGSATRLHNCKVSGRAFANDTPPVFVNMPQISFTNNSWMNVTCSPYKLPCNVAPDMQTVQVCKDTSGCSKFIKEALLQAKEFNPGAFLFETGGACKMWCKENGITYVEAPWKAAMATFCKIFEPMQAVIKGSPTMRTGPWLVSSLRWTLLDEWLQGRISGAVPAPEQFNICDTDQMVYINSHSFFQRFNNGNLDMAICKFGGMTTNGVFSFFTKESHHDLAEFYVKYIGRIQPPCGSDMDILHLYTGHQSWHHICKYPRVEDTVFCAENSCKPFLSDRVSEGLLVDTEDRYQQYPAASKGLFYRNGSLHFCLREPGAVVYNGNCNKYERQVSVHFQTSGKLKMFWHFRPNLERIPKGSCRSCLMEDCDCSDFKCENCWDKCFGKCEALQNFAKAVL